MKRTNRDACATAHTRESAQRGRGIAGAVLADGVYHRCRITAAADRLQSGGVGLCACGLLATVCADRLWCCLLLYGCDHACWWSGDDEARGERGKR